MAQVSYSNPHTGVTHVVELDMLAKYVCELSAEKVTASTSRSTQPALLPVRGVIEGLECLWGGTFDCQVPFPRRSEYEDRRARVRRQT